MLQKRRAGQMRRKLTVEALENRVVPAGAMLFTQDFLGVVHGSVFGADAGHQYTLNEDNSLFGAPTLHVQGQAGTFIAGQSMFLLSSVTGISITDGDKINFIQFGNVNGFTIPGNISVVVDPLGTGQDKVTTLNVNVPAGAFTFFASKGSQDIVKNTNDEFGAAMITTGDATVTQTNVTIGSDFITTTASPGTDTVTVQHSRIGPAPRVPAIGLLNIHVNSATNIVDVNDITVLRAGIFATSGATDNNSLTLENSTYLSATIQGGTEGGKGGDFSTSTINVNNDINTYNVDDGPVTALTVKALNSAGLGGTGSDSHINMNNDSFVGGDVFVQIDSGTPVHWKSSASAFDHGYTLLMSLVQDTGNMTVLGGNHAADVELGGPPHLLENNDVDVENLFVHLGTDVATVLVTSKTFGDEDVIMGDVASDGSIGPAQAHVLINGTVGLQDDTDTDLDLFIRVGNNTNTNLGGGWLVKINEAVAGSLRLSGGDGLDVNVDPTTVGNELSIEVGRGGVNEITVISLSDVTASDVEIEWFSDAGEAGGTNPFNGDPTGVFINLTNVVVSDPNPFNTFGDGFFDANLTMKDENPDPTSGEVGHGQDFVTLNNVAVNHPTGGGTLDIGLSDSETNVLSAHAVTCAFGTIDGDSSGGAVGTGNTYIGSLDPTNHGYAVIDFAFLLP